MGNIRAREETGNLVIDFRYRNLRCREQTALQNTAANRKQLQKLLDRIEAEITLGSFEYASYFPSSRMLSKFDAQTEVAVRHGLAPPLFESFVEDWFQETSIAWRDSYKTTIRGVLDIRIINYFGKKRVDHITKAELLQFRALLAKVVRKTGKSLSATHINRHMKVLRMILNEAADRFDFMTPYRGIKPLKVQKSNIDPFTFNEIHQVLNSVRSDFRDYFTVRFFTGLRTGEIDGLKWRYVDFEQSQILVRETIVRGKVEYTKTDGGQREVQMSAPVLEALRRQHSVSGGGEYVFCNSRGNPLCHNNVTKRVWYPLIKSLKLRLRNPYQTRHTAATLWLASGENPEWIARQMGHANTEMLFRVYSRYVPNLTRQDGSAFDQLLASRLGDSL